MGRGVYFDSQFGGAACHGKQGREKLMLLFILFAFHFLFTLFLFCSVLFYLVHDLSPWDGTAHIRMGLLYSVKLP